MDTLAPDSRDLVPAAGLVAYEFGSKILIPMCGGRPATEAPTAIFISDLLASAACSLAPRNPHNRIK